MINVDELTKKQIKWCSILMFECNYIRKLGKNNPVTLRKFQQLITRNKKYVGGPAYSFLQDLVKLSILKRVEVEHTNRLLDTQLYILDKKELKAQTLSSKSIIVKYVCDSLIGTGHYKPEDNQ